MRSALSVLVPGALLAAMIASAAGADVAAIGALPTRVEVAAAVARLKSDPNLGVEREIRSLRWIRAGNPTKDHKPFAWVRGLFEYLSRTASALMWLAGAVCAGFAAVFVRRVIREQRPPGLAAPLHRLPLAAGIAVTWGRLLRLLAIGGLAALLVWIATHTYWQSITVPAPMKGDAARNPYYAVEQLARSLGITVRMIGSLHALPPDAIVLVNSLHDDLRHESLDDVQAWVQSGGRLIIGRDTLEGNEALQTWSGIKPVKPPPPAAAPHRPMRPVAMCPAMVVRIDGAPSGRTMTMCRWMEGGLVSERIPSWSLADGADLEALRVTIDSGELTVLSQVAILSNWALLQHDHAEVFVDAADLRRGDLLLILAPFRPEPLPLLLWRLAAPAIVFFGVALMLLVLRHLPRFGPPLALAPRARRSLAEQIRAAARFSWRTRRLDALRAALRRALEESAQRRIAGYARMSARERASALSASTGIDAVAIGAALSRDGSGDLNEHRAAITLMEACRRILQRSDSHRRHHA